MRKIFYLILICFFIPNLMKAQNGFLADSDFFIHDNNSGKGIMINNAYELNSVVKTSRTENSNAVIFNRGSSWKQSMFSGYIDGKVSTNIEENFVFPVGNNNKYSPLGLSNSQNSAVCYYNETPIESQTIGAQGLEIIAENGYWTVLSNNMSKVSLYFTDSSVNVEKLTIVGLKENVWTVLPSGIEALAFDIRRSELTFSKKINAQKGRVISTTNAVNLTNYKAFAIAVAVPVDASIASAAKAVKEEMSYEHLKSIHFPFNEKNLTEYSTNLLNKLARDIPKNAKLKLVGHTDFYGSSDYNYSFGMERANTIKAFLERNGISNVEIEIQSEGEDSPKNDCKDCPSKEMVLNRRVDVYVVY